MRISDIMHSLRSTFDDWSPQCLANPRFIRRQNTITWVENAHQRLNHIVLASDVSHLTDTGQYTFQTSTDGSLFQIYYKFNYQGTAIEAAQLAFYSSRSEVSSLLNNTVDEQNVPEIDLADSVMEDDHDEDTIDETYQVAGILADGPVGWLRIDYAPQQAQGVLHYDCHMHVSLFPHSRIPVASIPSPKQFVEFIIALCYPEEYHEHRLNDNGQYVNPDSMRSLNTLCIPLDNDIFCCIAHFCIPIDRA